MVKTSSPATTQAATRSSDGTQVLRRAAAILRSVAQAGASGVSLADLARAHALARPTAHRILQCLVSETILAQEEADKRYRV
ncbi:MAG: helix-turn-helix domain-containing protein, partial [Pseudomonadota bacterium]